MRILIHGMNYAPELVGIGKYTGELGAWLASRGHRVTVLTAPPYYPQWRVQEGTGPSGGGGNGWMGWKCSGPHSTCPARVTGKGRLLQEISFGASGLYWWSDLLAAATLGRGGGGVPTHDFRAGSGAPGPAPRHSSGYSRPGPAVGRGPGIGNPAAAACCWPG